jgi:hypothetical protein
VAPACEARLSLVHLTQTATAGARAQRAAEWGVCHSASQSASVDTGAVSQRPSSASVDSCRPEAPARRPRRRCAAGREPARPRPARPEVRRRRPPARAAPASTREYPRRPALRLTPTERPCLIQCRLKYRKADPGTSPKAPRVRLTLHLQVAPMSGLPSGALGGKPATAPRGAARCNGTRRCHSGPRACRLCASQRHGEGPPTQHGCGPTAAAALGARVPGCPGAGQSASVWAVASQMQAPTGPAGGAPSAARSRAPPSEGGPTPRGCLTPRGCRLSLSPGPGYYRKFYIALGKHDGEGDQEDPGEEEGRPREEEDLGEEGRFDPANTAPGYFGKSCAFGGRSFRTGHEQTTTERISRSTCADDSWGSKDVGGECFKRAEGRPQTLHLLPQRRVPCKERGERSE